MSVPLPKSPDPDQTEVHPDLDYGPRVPDLTPSSALVELEAMEAELERSEPATKRHNEDDSE